MPSLKLLSGFRARGQAEAVSSRDHQGTSLCPHFCGGALRPAWASCRCSWSDRLLPGLWVGAAPRGRAYLGSQSSFQEALGGALAGFRIRSCLALPVCEWHQVAAVVGAPVAAASLPREELLSIPQQQCPQPSRWGYHGPWAQGLRCRGPGF